jgi:hypothetical protein
VAFFLALETASIRTGHFSYSLASPASVPRSSLHSPRQRTTWWRQWRRSLCIWGTAPASAQYAPTSWSVSSQKTGKWPEKKRRQEARGLRPKTLFSFSSGPYARRAQAVMRRMRPEITDSASAEDTRAGPAAQSRLALECARGKAPAGGRERLEPFAVSTGGWQIPRDKQHCATNVPRVISTAPQNQPQV